MKPRPHAVCAACPHDRRAHDMPVENRGYNGCAAFDCACLEFVPAKRRRRRSTGLRRPGEAQKRYGYSRPISLCEHGNDPMHRCPDHEWFRSKWERTFAALLDAFGIEWLYEPCTFRGPSGSFTPDFEISSTMKDRVYVELHRLENDDPRDGGRKRAHLPMWSRLVRRQSGGYPLLVLGEAAMREVVRLRKALAPDAEARFREREKEF